MADAITKAKWDKASKTFDAMSGVGTEKRWAPVKQEFFSQMGDGKILFLAVGTGLDIASFPKGKNIIGIDISPKMLEFAQPRVDTYDGKMEISEIDVMDLPYEEHSFDQVFTSCTFCSVPNPVEGLKALYRVLKPGGELHMFEHTGSRIFPFNLMLNLMTPLTRNLGPEMNRPTQDNVKKAGFTLTGLNHIYMDVVKIIHAIAEK
jgi:ubiquinone/menaquinone biosynthesis C-methylase UbiE